LEALKHCFPPVADARTRLLLLGSLPGEQSLARGHYYANPRNQFWRLIGAVIGRELEPLPYRDRLDALLEAGVGLWDTIGSATRRGSLDGAIRDESANDLAELAATLPALRAVAFNGGKSAALGMKLLAGDRRLTLVALPSSSPAYTLPFEAKAEEWLKLRAYL
jgi:TDG/mug DNA glycosylase family protein